MGWRDAFKREKRGSSPVWPEWAAARGWRYDSEPSDLVGRFYEPLTGRGWREEYAWSVTGHRGSLAFVLFHRAYEGPSPTRGNAVKSLYHLAVALPRMPNADLRAVSPEQAFTQLGGSLAGRFGFDEWRGQWMLGAARVVLPYEVDGTLDQIDAQIALAPDAVWQPGEA